VQNQYIGAWVKGFYRVANYAIKADMIDKTIEAKLKVLTFWDKHGIEAALDYSQKSRRTLYHWKKQYKQSGISGLAAKSTAPRRRRKRCWSPLIGQQLRHWRTELPNLGKEQLYVLLKPWCAQHQLACPSESTIGRLIQEAPDKMRVSPPLLTAKGKPKAYKRKPVSRRPKGYKASRIGECVGLDAIERRMGTMKMYILTYIDEVSDYALAMAVPCLTSQAAKQFFEKCFRLTPFHVEQVITDNGSEFKGEFDRLLRDAQITHLWTYPSTPKMNAICERFNRTIQETFVDFHEDILFTDIDGFNEELADWLVKYNSLRPHKGLGLKTPVEYIIKHHPKCNMWWTHTQI
jgi:transposase InsO family protein